METERMWEVGEMVVVQGATSNTGIVLATDN